MPDPISWSHDAPYFLAAFLVGYLSGSIPFGLLLTRWAGLGDIRKIGSGNIGATNVLRTGNKKVAAATLLLDALKGLIPVLLAKIFYGPDITVIVAFAAFVGHLFPVWLGFKGGKGIAVALGILLGLNWLIGLVSFAVWIGVAYLSRLSSLSALVAAGIAPLLFWFNAQYQYAEMAAILSILIWISHRENIRRLWAGTESRIGSKG